MMKKVLWTLAVDYLVDVDGEGGVIAYYSRGHHDKAAFLKEIEKEFEQHFEDTEPVRHQYGRWSMYGKYGSVMDIYAKPGKGRFPVTYFYVG